ncbi:SufE family protein [Pleionea sediminis]|uniref:SufE family protein n=1 Tax=Pleionea sediminis TaxID=2569479 RepID=UPI0011865ACE|nr:SufE family protein [Pleionea sediminis]
MSNPFGKTITSDDIIEDLSFFDSWEDRYRYIIDLGKQLPEIDDSLKTDERLVRGCQSQVWLEPYFENDTLSFDVDSDAHIVRGLLAMVMSAYNYKSPNDVIDFDIESFFGKIDLVKHLSPTRGNGLRAMVKRIQSIAQEKAS